MPDFVSSGQTTRAENENNPAEDVDQQVERKSLFEQLQENRDQKERDFQEQLNAHNSSYKLNEQSAQFYEQLRKKRRESREKLKKEEDAQLNRFLEKKKQRTLTPAHKSLQVTKPPRIPLKGKRAQIEMNLLTPLHPKTTKESSSSSSRPAIEENQNVLIDSALDYESDTDSD